jgi:hypothetical protein
VNDEANIQIGGGANHAAKEVEDKKENALVGSFFQSLHQHHLHVDGLDVQESI